MSRTVMALYEDFDVARDVVEDLVEAGFDRNNISLVANDASGEYANYVNNAGDGDDDVKSGDGAGFGAVVGTLVGLGVALIPGVGPVLAAGPLAAALFAGIGAASGAVTGGVVAGLVDLGVPEDEAGHYAEGIRRGGALVSLTTDDTGASRAQEIMNRHNPVDLNERTEAWRTSSTGYSGYNASAAPLTSDQINTERQTYRTVEAGDRAKLDVVEEELQVGKREVERGGVRVVSRITETPVQEQVNLREEHVQVERHAVDRPATSADLDTFTEGVIEVTEHAEEAVVAKTARVVEEVVVGKEATERTETINDTVRRKDVEVQPLTGTTTTTYNAYETYEPTFRQNYNSYFKNSGYTYEQFDPAYRYGYTLATNDQYRDYDWDRVETDARQYWEERNPNTWDQFKASIRNAWDQVRGR